MSARMSKKIAEAIRKVYQECRTPDEFYAVFNDRIIEAEGLTTPATPEEQARINAIKNSKTKIKIAVHTIVTMFKESFKGFNEMINEFNEFIKNADFKKNEDRVGLKTRLEAIKNAKAELLPHAQKINDIITLGKTRGFIPNTEAFTMPAIGITNAMAKEIFKNLMTKKKEIEDLIYDPDKKTTDLTELSARITEIDTDLADNVPDKTQYENDKTEIINALSGPRMGGTPGTPGGTPGTPGETPGTPGETPGTPGETPGTPGETPGTPGGTPGTPGETPGTPGTPGGTPGTPGGAPDSPFIPSEGFRDKYKLIVEKINALASSLAIQETKIQNENLIVMSGFEFDRMEAVISMDRTAHNYEMSMIDAERDLTLLEYEEYKKNPVYYAKYDRQLMDAKINKDNLKNIYNNQPINEFFDEHATIIQNAHEKLADPSISEAQKEILQNIIVAEKNTINRRLIGLASFDNTFDLRQFLNDNSNKLRPRPRPLTPPGPEPTDPKAEFETKLKEFINEEYLLNIDLYKDPANIVTNKPIVVALIRRRNEFISTFAALTTMEKSLIESSLRPFTIELQNKLSDRFGEKNMQIIMSDEWQELVTNFTTLVTYDETIYKNMEQKIAQLRTRFPDLDINIDDKYIVTVDFNNPEITNFTKAMLSEKAIEEKKAKDAPSGPDTPGETPGTPGETPGTPGETPGTPGETPGTPGGGDPAKDSNINILYDALASDFIRRYEKEEKVKATHMSFKEYFQSNFIPFIKEVKETAKHSSLNKYLSLAEDGKTLIWKNNGVSVEVNFTDFAKYMIAKKGELLRTRLKGIGTTAKFNPNRKKNPQIDRAKAVIVNAIITGEMFERTGAKKTTLVVKNFFASKLEAEGLSHDVKGRISVDSKVERHVNADTSDVEYVITPDLDSEEQKWSVKVIDKETKETIYTIDFAFTQELEKSGARGL